MFTSGLKSTTTPMPFGVSQGSVLGPLFFVLCTPNAFRIAEELDFSIPGYAKDLWACDHCFVHDTALAWCSFTSSFQALFPPLSMNSSRPNLAGYFISVSSIKGCSHLCSAAAGLLCVPSYLDWHWHWIGPRAFAASSPAAWNSLPVDLRDPGLNFLSLFNTVNWFLGFIHFSVIFCYLRTAFETFFEKHYFDNDSNFMTKRRLPT